MAQTLKRILAAIMFTDIQGYTALMQRDEQESLKIRNRHREVFNAAMSKYEGEILQYYGDGTLSIFYSAVDAVKCGIELQTAFLSKPSIPVRIGIHSGDIVYNNEEIIGDSVNVASRLESLAIAGSLLISDKIYHEIKNHTSILSHFLGKVLLKNVKDPLHVYSVVNTPLIIPSFDSLGNKGRVKSKTLAVLPFVNMNRSSEDDSFSDGITEEILNVLAKIEGLQVTSRTSAFYFKDKNQNIKEIGASLNVEYVLEGSVRKAGQNVRITAQLIQVSDDFHLWSDRYDKALEDVFAVQDEIAEKISNELIRKLNIRIADPSPRRKINIQAHQTYLKGRYYFNKWSPDMMPNAIDSFNDAIKRDPNYAEAYAGIAGCYIFLGMIGYDSSNFEKGRVSAVKSYELEPHNEHSLLALAMSKSLLDKNLVEAESLFTRTLEINPNNATAHHYYAMHLGHCGKLQLALVEYRRAAELDPLSLSINTEYGIALAMNDQYDLALQQLDKTIELNRNFRTAWEAKGWVYLYKAEYELSLGSFAKYQALTGSNNKGLTGLAVVNAKLGNKQKSRDYLKTMLQRNMEEKDLIMDMDLAMVYLSLGEINKAIDYLESGLKKGQGALFINTSPYFRTLQGHPRFEILREKYLPGK